MARVADQDVDGAGIQLGDHPVCACVIMKSDFVEKTIPPLRIDTEMKRGQKTIERGNQRAFCGVARLRGARSV